LSQVSFNQTIENHYPITVMERQYSNLEKLNKCLYSLIETFESNDKNTNKNAVNSGKISTSGGFQTSLDLNLFDSNNVYIQELKSSVILPSIKSYLNEVFEKESENIVPEVVGWSNILQAGDWQRPHMHPTVNNLASGCYYVHVPELTGKEEGRIEFINPMPVSVHHGYSNSRRLTPESGKLLLFPPYYNHFVHPLKSAGKRIMIAFDVIAVKRKTQFVF